MKIGRLTLRERVPGTTRHRARWQCGCDCGNSISVNASSLCREKQTRSCGCLKHHTVTLDGQHKWCSGCQENRPLQDFSFQVRRGKTTPRCFCKTCTSTNNAKRNEYFRAWKAKKLYGLDENQLSDLYEKSEGKCEICGIPETKVRGSLCIDHDHASGVVRGLLCRNCNSGMGKLGDSVDMLNRAIAYLNRSGQTRRQ
jgi:hypothetical protein